MSKIVVGIDPGKTGAVAVWLADHWEVHDCPTLRLETRNTKTKSGKSVKDMPDPAGMARLLEQYNYAEAQVFIEKVNAGSQQGVTAMFNFGMGYGMWLGILATLQMPYTFVMPQVWKKIMVPGVGKDKDASRLRVKQLFPELSELVARVKDDGRADALLIAEYGRRQL